MSLAASTVDMVKLLLGYGAELDPADHRQRTPLHLVANKSTASEDESKELEQFLIRKGANLFLTDVRGRLPLHYLFVKIGR